MRAVGWGIVSVSEIAVAGSYAFLMSALHLHRDLHDVGGCDVCAFDARRLRDLSSVLCDPHGVGRDVLLFGLLLADCERICVVGSVCESFHDHHLVVVSSCGRLVGLVAVAQRR